MSPESVELIRDLTYLASSVLFILAIKGLGSPRGARQANALGAVGMLLAVVATLAMTRTLGLGSILAGLTLGSAIGVLMAVKTPMTGMPQMVGLLNGFGGLASLLVACAEYAKTPAGQLDAVAGALCGVGALIGGLTLTGSLVAYAKLEGLVPGRPMALPLNELWAGALLAGSLVLSGLLAAGTVGSAALIAIVVAALVLGVLLVLPIGGADMPVVVALMNSYSGLAAAATGFLLNNKSLIVSGALVGASGVILTHVMCKAMNRSLRNVLFARVGTDGGGGGAAGGQQGTVKIMSAEDAALLLDTAQLVMVVPGYGLAVSQAQHAVRDLARALEAKGCRVIHAMHPVAGRMPAQMNVLLAEAGIPYESQLDLDAANAEAAQCDVALVLGANDVVNPAARTDRSSPIYGMPIVDVDKARSVLVVKRSLGAGYAGVDNPLFVSPTTSMVLGDAKKVLSEILGALKAL